MVSSPTSGHPDRRHTGPRRRRRTQVGRGYSDAFDRSERVGGRGGTCPGYLPRGDSGGRRDERRILGRGCPFGGAMKLETGERQDTRPAGTSLDAPPRGAEQGEIAYVLKAFGRTS